MLNCEKCQDLLSDYLDNSLSDEKRSEIAFHVNDCAACSSVAAELEAIVGFCRAHRGDYEAPPDSERLWARIRESVELEQIFQPPIPSNVPIATSNWFGRLLNKSWEMTLPQVATAIAAIIIAASLATILGVRKMAGKPFSSSETRNNRVSENLDSGQSLAGRTAIDDRFRDQQLLIDYWNQRVESKKGHWDPRMREAFETNLTIIDQALTDSREQLKRNPHDEVSEEMLNTALNDKMQLLKEFSDL